jgi:hypothetical protein
VHSPSTLSCSPSISLTLSPFNSLRPPAASLIVVNAIKSICTLPDSSFPTPLACDIWPLSRGRQGGYSQQTTLSTRPSPPQSQTIARTDLTSHPQQCSLHRSSSPSPKLPSSSLSPRKLDPDLPIPATRSLVHSKLCHQPSPLISAWDTLRFDTGEAYISSYNNILERKSSTTLQSWRPGSAGRCFWLL